MLLSDSQRPSLHLWRGDFCVAACLCSTVYGKQATFIRKFGFFYFPVLFFFSFFFFSSFGIERTYTDTVCKRDKRRSSIPMSSYIRLNQNEILFFFSPPLPVCVALSLLDFIFRLGSFQVWILLKYSFTFLLSISLLGRLGLLISSRASIEPLHSVYDKNRPFFSLVLFRRSLFTSSPIEIKV